MHLRYSGLYSLLLVSKATYLYGILYFSLISLIGINGVPRTIGLIQPVLLLVLISSWRIILKFFLSRLNNINKGNKKTINALVYGSGAAGRQLVRAMQESSEISIKGFLDDDANQQGCQIDGKLIYSPQKLRSLIKEKGISLVLLAVPSAERKKELR